MEPDFSGWATKANLKCSDGRTITSDAFKHNDGARVPLVWQHGHNSVENVLGHAILKHVDGQGTRADAYFNTTPSGVNAKKLVDNGDIKHLSIYANNLVEKAMGAGKAVLHGDIREVSLVLAGANPGALIDQVNVRHGDGSYETLDEEAVIYTGEEFFHAAGDPDNDGDKDTQKEIEQGDPDQGDPSDTTIQQVWDSMNPTQQNVMNYIVAEAVANSQGANDAEHSDDKKEGTGEVTLTHSIFQQDQGTVTQNKRELSHAEIKSIFEDAQKPGETLKTAVEGFCLKHGITPMDVLFPNFKNLDATPQFNTRRMEWVAPFLGALSHTPFSRVRSITADITMDEARARGYIKGTLKKDEWFTVSRRTTGPTTVYKRQTFDRDDILDITDFDVVSWVKAEMDMMLREEIARAILIGDGREVDDPDKIKDPMNAASGDGLRSIVNENELYKTDVNINLGSTPNYKLIPDQVLASMEYYKGSGTPNFYTTLPTMIKLLTIRDDFGHRLYPTKADLAAEMGVADIIPVEVMEGYTATAGSLLGIIVNPADYNVGADKGGEVNLFDFFDIDYNQLKHLIETRISGALTKIKSAMVVWSVPSADVAVVPTAPTFNSTTGVVTVTATTGVVYKDGNGNTLTAGAQTAIDAGASITIVATPASGYYFAYSGLQTAYWNFTRQDGEGTPQS